MWKSREAFEKSTFFKRLKLQGFEEVAGLWDVLQSGKLKSERVFRLNPLRNALLEDFKLEGFKFGSELAKFPQTYHFQLPENAIHSQHPFWGSGLGYVQDPVALEIVDDLQVQKGNWVMDLCAAPGGKSTRVSEILDNTGWLLSNDSDLKRSRILSHNLIRHGAMRSTIFAKDGVSLSKLFPETFDRILLDAPCSGESLFFKREERRRDVYESEVQEVAQIQIALMQAAAGALKAGGRFVYSTCTYNVTENNEMTRRFLKQNTDFELVKEERRWPQLRYGEIQTAGGYWAVFQKKGVAINSSDRLLRHPDAERHAILDKDGKVNLYAQTMLPDNIELPKEEDLFAPAGENFEDWILMTHEEARSYLAGEALPNPGRKHGLQRMLFRGKWPLGPAKGVESRFNNLLPLETRAQFRNL